MTTSLKILALVNGPPGSAASERALNLLGRSRFVTAGRCRLVVAYRGRRKFAAVFDFARQLLRYRPAIVYVVDMAAAGVLAAVAYRLVFRRSWLVIDTGDAIAALARKIGSRSYLGVAATAALERVGQRVADRLVVRGTGHVGHLGRYAGKATIIQDGVDVAAFASVPPIATAAGAFTPDDPLVVGVLGSLYWVPTLRWCYGVELLEALNHLGPDRPVRGLIVGDGDGLPHLREQAERLAVGDRVTFVGRVTPDCIPNVLAQMHVALSTQSADLVGQVRTTGKLPLYLAAGRYVVASRVGEAARVLPDAMLVDYHGAFDPTYPRRLADRLARLAADRSAVALAAAAGPSLALSFDYATLADRLDAAVLWPPFRT